MPSYWLAPSANSLKKRASLLVPITVIKKYIPTLYVNHP